MVLAAWTWSLFLEEWWPEFEGAKSAEERSVSSSGSLAISSKRRIPPGVFSAMCLINFSLGWDVSGRFSRKDSFALGMTGSFVLFRSESTEFLFLLSENLFCLEPESSHESEDDLFLERCPFSRLERLLFPGTASLCLPCSCLGLHFFPTPEDFKERLLASEKEFSELILCSICSFLNFFCSRSRQ